MDQRSNGMATLALGSGVAVWVLFVLGMCVSFVPILNWFSFLFVLLEFVVALTGLVSGILGWRQARVTAIGGTPAVVGMLLSLAWFLVEAMLLLLGLGLLGLFGLLVLAGNV